MFHTIKILNQRIRWIFLLSLGFVALGFMGPIAALGAGPAPVDLLSAGDFAILAETAITNTGGTSIAGDIGISPNGATSITGFALTMDSSGEFSTSAQVTGKIYAATYAAPTPSNMTTAINDMLTAYNNAAGLSNPTATELGAGNISGMTLAPGLYKWSTDVNIYSDVTLSGSASDVWIFQIARDLDIAAAGSVLTGIKVELTGGALASNVFWQVGGGTGATLGTYSTFNGTILSAKQIIIETGAVLNGRALAQTQVTLDANGITGTDPAGCPIISLLPPPLPNGNVGVDYNQTITASGGTGSYTFSLTNSLPDGLLLDSVTGIISGPPTTVGTSTFTVTATDDETACTGLQTYTIVINEETCSDITLLAPPLSPGTVGIDYNQTITAEGGTGPYTYSITDGSLPAVLLLTGDTISGTPTTVGTFTFTVTATDTTTGCIGFQAYTIIINAGTCDPISLSPSLSPGTVGIEYNQTITASGGTEPYTYSILTGALPTGLDPFNTEGPGVISGTPTTAGTFRVKVTATDNSGCKVSQSYTIVINSQTAAIPTLSEWGMIFFMVLLGLTAFYYIRRRKVDF